MYKKISFFFIYIILFSLLLSTPALSIGTVRLDQPDTIYPLGLHLEYLEDPGGVLSIKDVASGQSPHQFQKSSEKNLNFGFSSSAYWLRFKLKFDQNALNTDWIIAQEYPSIDSITLYVPDGKGDYIVKLTGRSFPFSHRENKHRMLNFILPLNTGNEITCYLRYSSESSMVIPLQLYSHPTFINMDHEYQIGLGIYYGFMLLIALHSLFLYFYLSDRNYLYYFLFIFTLTLWVMNLNGTSYEYLWPSLVWWNKKSFTIIGGMCLFAVIKLTQAFLSTNENTPRLHTILSYCSYACAALIVSSVFLSYTYNIRIIIGLTFVCFPVLIVTGTYFLVQKFRQARFYLASWVMLFVGTIISSIKAAGFIPHTFITNNAIQIGFVFQAFFLAIALADRFKIIESEKNDAQAQAAQSIKKADFVRHEMIGILEEKVKERTLKLQETMNEVNRQKEILEAVASTDPLIGKSWIATRKYKRCWEV